DIIRSDLRLDDPKGTVCLLNKAIFEGLARMRMEVAELRMLRWTCGKTMVDMIPNRVLRAELDVDIIIDKKREGRLIWFGHVKRKPQTEPVRRVEALLVNGLKRKGRAKLRSDDILK
nr:putative reverse transcriptase domain, nucleoporin, Nup155-like protein [Tanacetum cinerariifolium]